MGLEQRLSPSPTPIQSQSQTLTLNSISLSPTPIQSQSQSQTLTLNSISLTAIALRDNDEVDDGVKEKEDQDRDDAYEEEVRGRKSTKGGNASSSGGEKRARSDFINGADIEGDKDDKDYNGGGGGRAGMEEKQRWSRFCKWEDEVDEDDEDEVDENEEEKEEDERDGVDSELAVLSGVLVNVLRSGEDPYVGVIQDVSADGTYQVAMGESGNGDVYTVAHTDVEMIRPKKFEKLKVISGAFRGTTANLIGIFDSDGISCGIVKRDTHSWDVYVLEMNLLAKMVSNGGEKRVRFDFINGTDIEGDKDDKDYSGSGGGRGGMEQKQRWSRFCKWEDEVDEDDEDEMDEDEEEKEEDEGDGVDSDLGVLSGVLVNVLRSGEDPYVGVIQDVSADGTYQVAMGESGNGDVCTVARTDVEMIRPKKFEKLKVISGAFRGTTANLIGIVDSDGIVKRDTHSWDVYVLDMNILAKMVS